MKKKEDLAVDPRSRVVNERERNVVPDPVNPSVVAVFLVRSSLKEELHKATTGLYWVQHSPLTAWLALHLSRLKTCPEGTEEPVISVSS